MIRKLKNIIKKYLGGEEARLYGYRIGESLRKFGAENKKQYYRLFKAIIVWLNVYLDKYIE